jgi:hypothetical protein
MIGLRLLVSRVPGIAWVILLVLALLAAAGYGLYRHGEALGEVKVHRMALADSTVQQRATVQEATQHADSAIVVAETAVDRTNVGRRRTRAVLDVARDSMPASAYQVVSEQLDRDSSTITLQTAAINELVTERATRIQLDTLLEHQVVFKPPGDDGTSLADVAKDVGVVALVVEVIRFILQLLHR